MGNTSASPKDTSPNKLGTAADLDLIPLRKRFEELAGPPSGDPGHEQERFILFDDWSKLVGPRGAQVAVRLYTVLDAGGDGRLDFQEFSTAACLLKGSPDDHKLALLFKMYGNANKGGLVGREGLKAFILDIITASPPPLAPLELFGEGGGGGDGGEPRPLPPAVRRQGSGAGPGEPDAPHFEKELSAVLSKMAGVVLTEYDADNDGMLTEKEFKAYAKREEESVNAFLKTLSDSVGKVLVP